TASPSAAVSPAPRGDEAAVLAAALTREQSLLAAYDKALRRLPALAPTLQALRAHHQAHADRLGGKAGRPPAGPGRAIVPPRRTSATAAVLGTLTDAELGAARAGVSAVGAASPAVGVLLAEIAGSEEQHAVLLRWLSGADR
ncbi:MAG TPA: ferritin-like domain-containing protein, partial [Mycobacteriales bacterium]|nr:ferritin-like domain-containing protein [Mycobacteriales bacterium]